MESPFPSGCAERFRVERALAMGGSGTVYLATQVGLDRPVAVKILHRDVGHDDDVISRFLDEARITACLSHPNIIVVIDSGYDDNTPWIAYEYLPGCSLRDLLAHTAIAWPQALAIGVQVASALEEAHSKGVLHRDIKPENVIEVRPGKYKVTDFGIAKLMQETHGRTQTGFVMGTPAYISPEQIRGGLPTPRSDLYSLGIMLFELVTGRVPFDAGNPFLLFQQHLTQKVPAIHELHPDIPPSVNAVIQRALAKDPEHRFASAVEFRAALEDLVILISGRVAQPRLPHPSRFARVAAARPRPRRTGVSLWLVAAILAVLISGGMGALATRYLTFITLKPVIDEAPGARRGVPNWKREELQQRLVNSVDQMKEWWGVHAEVVGHTSPLRSNPSEGLRLVESLLDDERRNRMDLGRIVECLCESCYDLPSFPDRELGMLVRARCFHFLSWADIQRLEGLRSNFNSVISSKDTPLVPFVNGTPHYGVVFGREGVYSLQEYFTTLLFAMTRIGREPVESGLLDLVRDLALVGRSLRPSPLMLQLAPEFVPCVEKFTQSLHRLPGTVGSAVSRIALAYWDVGLSGGTTERIRTLTSSIRMDTAILRRCLHRRDEGELRRLESMLGRIGVFGEDQPAARP